MKIRVLSGVILLPIVLFLIYYGKLPLIIALFVVTIIGLYEFYKAVRINDFGLKLLTGLLTVGVYVSFIVGTYDYMHLIILAFIIGCLFIFAMKYPKIRMEHLALIVFGVVYIVFLLSHIVLVRSETMHGNWMVWMIFVIAFGSDSSAYFVGVNFGKHKLVPKLSPNKTIEGAIGGIIGAGILSAIFGLIMYSYGPLSDLTEIIPFFFIGVVGSMISQLGDLVGSAMKRQTQIKDFGKIIPGHGGILDRLDSILLTAPYIYIVITLLYK